MTLWLALHAVIKCHIVQKKMQRSKMITFEVIRFAFDYCSLGLHHLSLSTWLVDPEHLDYLRHGTLL